MKLSNSSVLHPATSSALGLNIIPHYASNRYNDVEAHLHSQYKSSNLPHPVHEGAPRVGSGLIDASAEDDACAEIVSPD